MADPRQLAVEKLHKCYEGDKLRVLVGNGLSMASGFPSWEELNLGLLHGLVQRDASQQNVWATLLAPVLPELSKSMLGILGRDGAADFVQLAWEETKFRQELRRVLYKGRSVDVLPLTATHYQTAAMISKAAIATTNFDPLLELAASKLDPANAYWESFRCAPGNVDGVTGRIEHLHGWIDPEGVSDRRPVSDTDQPGRLILTESDYFRFAANRMDPANRRLTSFFTAPGAALVVGMSMADMNIRRILFLLSERAYAKRGRAKVNGQASIYLVLKQREPLVDNYTSEYWASRGLNLIFIQVHEELAGLLRDIRWGIAAAGALPAWVETALQWRTRVVPDRVMLSDQWQSVACLYLRNRRRQIRRMFAVPSEERCELAVFVPLRHKEEGTIRLSVMTSSKRLRNGDEARAHARKRRPSETPCCCGTVTKPAPTRENDGYPLQGAKSRESPAWPFQAALSVTRPLATELWISSSRPECGQTG